MSSQEARAASSQESWQAIHDDGGDLYPDGSIQRNNVEGEGAFTEDVALPSESGAARYRQLRAEQNAGTESRGLFGRARALITGLGSWAKKFSDKDSN